VKPVQIRADELLLRPWRPDDAEAVHRACQDPALHRWLTGLPRPYRMADAAAFVGDLAPRWLADGRALHLGVFDPDGLVGSVALNAVDRGAGTAELGYWSAPWARGRRVAERAARALLTWSFSTPEPADEPRPSRGNGANPRNAPGPEEGPGTGPAAENREKGPGDGNWTDGLALGRVDWHATVGNHASRLTALRLGFRMIGERPGAARPSAARPSAAGSGTAGPGTAQARTGAQPDRWLAALLPGDLTAAGTEVPEAVRRTAHTFGRAHPTLPAGPVTLRPPAQRDLAGILEARADPEVARWFGVPQPYRKVDAVRHIERTVPHRWARGVEAVFAIADAGDAYAGSIDLRILPGDPAVGEVGFLVSPWARGRGYAPAALRAICGWGFEALGLARIQWRAEIGNDASRRAAQKAGFTMEGVLRQALGVDGKRRDCWVGARVRGELT
jgi:RimJ/RimL family protein N-acetyltransferase